MFRNKPKFQPITCFRNETYDSFPTAQFLMSSFCKRYRLDRCSNGWGLLLYIREDVLSRLLTEYKPPENVECLFVEINFRKKKWILCFSYNPRKSNYTYIKNYT